MYKMKNKITRKKYQNSTKKTEHIKIKTNSNINTIHSRIST